MQTAHKTLGINFLVFFLFFTGFQFALGQGVQKPVPKEVKTNADGSLYVRYGYQEYLPIGYDTQPGKKWPLIITMVGLGERGDGSVQDLDTIANIGIPKLIRQGRDYPFLIMSPQPTGNQKIPHKDSPNPDTEGKFVPDTLAVFVDYILDNYPVDPNRVYITAFSAAVEQAYRYILPNADEVTAFVPVAGSGNSFSQEQLCNMRNVPVWAFHNLNDAVITYDRSQSAITKINRCDPVVPAKLTLYDRPNHDAWTWTYSGNGMGKELPGYAPFDETIFDWFLRFSKVLANAGEDQTVVLPTTSVVLNGSSTPATGVSYQWKQNYGPNTAILTNPNAAHVTVSNLVRGTYEFQLTVTDAQNNQATDKVMLTVETSNDFLTASAGSDTTVFLPLESVTLEGTGTDAYNEITGYQWVKLSGPEAILENADTQHLKIIEPQEGNYVFEFTVTNDNEGAVSDTVALTVLLAKLSADAGEDITVTLPVEALEITGKGTDPNPNNSITGYAWEKVEGPEVSMENADSETLTLTNLMKGVYQFAFTVTNDKSGSASDTVKVFVETTNDSLVADAGQDMAVALPISTIEFVGAGRDPYNEITGYAWTQLSGPAATLTNQDKATLSVSNLTEGTYQFELTVINDNDGLASDTVTLKVEPTPEPDAKTVAVLSPRESDFPYLSEVAVTVEIENVGNINLDGVEVGFQLNNQAAVIENINKSLSVDEIYTYTFTTPADLSLYDNYRLKVFTNMPADVNTANDTLNVVLKWLDTVSVNNYSESFEDGDGGWKVAGENSSWQRGEPKGAIINTASDGKNIWATNLSGSYNNNDSSFLVSPVFDFSEATSDPVLTFDLWWDMDSTDLLSISISTDGGATWNTLGNIEDTHNWFTTAAKGMNPAGWTGTGEEGSGQWITVSHPLTGTAGEPSVLIRIEFTSDADGTSIAEGAGIDHVHICQAAPGIAAVADITTSLEEEMPIEVPITISNADVATASIMAISDNQDLVPNENIQVLAENGNVKLLINALPDSLGSTHITLFVQEGCVSSVKFKVTVNEVTGIEDDLEVAAVVYPNPSTGIFTLKWKGSHTQATTARLFTSQGALLKQYHIVPAQDEFTIDLSTLAQGTYVLHLQQANKVRTYQLIRQ